MILDETDLASIAAFTFSDVTLMIPLDRNRRGTPLFFASVTVTIEPYVLRCREDFAQSDLAAVPFDTLRESRIVSPGQVHLVGLDGCVGYSLQMQPPSKARALSKVLTVRIPKLQQQQQYPADISSPLRVQGALYPTSLRDLPPYPCYDRTLRVQRRETATIHMAESALREHALHDTIEKERRAERRRRIHRNAMRERGKGGQSLSMPLSSASSAAREGLAKVYAEEVDLAVKRGEASQRFLEAEDYAERMARLKKTL